MANYLDLTTRSADYNSARLPRFKGNIRPTITVTDTHTHLADFDSGTYVFFEGEGGSTTNVFLPEPRKGLYFSIMVTKAHAGGGKFLIKPREGSGAKISVRTDIPSTELQRGQWTLTFSGVLREENVINGKADGDAMAAHTFAESHDASMEAIAIKVAALSSVSSCSASGNVLTVAGAEIGQWVDLDSFVVTGGEEDGRPTVAIACTHKPTDIATELTELVSSVVTAIELKNAAKEGLAAELIATDTKWYANFYAATAADIGLPL